MYSCYWEVTQAWEGTLAIPWPTAPPSPTHTHPRYCKIIKKLAFFAYASAKALTTNPYPLAVSGHSDFIPFFYMHKYIYVFETRKA